MNLDKAMTISNELGFLKTMQVSKCGANEFQDIVSVTVCHMGFDFNKQEYTNGMSYSSLDNIIEYDVFILLTNAKPFIAIPVNELVSDYEIKLTYNELRESFKNNIIKLKEMDKFIKTQIPNPESYLVTMLNPIS